MFILINVLYECVCYLQVVFVDDFCQGEKGLQISCDVVDGLFVEEIIEDKFVVRDKVVRVFDFVINVVRYNVEINVWWEVCMVCL